MATVQEGVAFVTPLRLRSETANLNGTGMIDLPQETIDLVLRSDPQSSGFLALDLPIRIEGSFDDVNIGPTRLQVGLQSLSPEEAVKRLPPDLQALAEGNQCWR